MREGSGDADFGRGSGGVDGGRELREKNGDLVDQERTEDVGALFAFVSKHGICEDIERREYEGDKSALTITLEFAGISFFLWS